MSATPRCLNRSLSFPDVCTVPVISSTVVVQQVFQNQNGTPALIRQYSCQEFRFDEANDSNTSSYASSNGQFTSAHLEKHRESKQFNRYSGSPMEVDPFEPTSSNKKVIDCIDLTKDDLDIHATNTVRNRLHENVREELKQNYRNITTSVGAESTTLIHYKTETNSYKPIISISAIALLIFGLLAYTIYDNDIYVYVNPDIQTANIRHELENGVIAQNDPVIIVTKTFERMHFWSKPIKVLAFIGSNGVGKTYMANLIKMHFLVKLVHEINAAQLNDELKRKNLADNIKSSNCNLLIIDDLKANDFKLMYGFVKSLPDNHRILVVVIFNIQETSDAKIHHIDYDMSTSIRNSFDSSDLYFELAYFDVLTRDEIESWLRNDLEKNVDANRHTEIIKLVLQDVDIQYNGFKGLRNKLNLILKNL